MKRLLWAIAILIIPPFAFWGAGSILRSRQKGPAYAGIIFGKKVSFEEYAASWQAAKNQTLLIYGPKFNEIYETIDLNRQAWDRLILLREAKRKRIRTSDKEVITTIQGFPFFQSRGEFDKRAYDMILSQVFKTTPRQFEEEIRAYLAILKLRDSVIGNVKLKNREVREAYKKENEKSRIVYILISPDIFKEGVKTPRQALANYYENNIESFRIPEQVNIEYLGFEFSDYEKGIQINDEEIKNYHETHKEEFDPKIEFKDLKDAIKNNLVRRAAKEKALFAAEKIDYILADKSKILEEVAKENSIPIKETGLFAKEGPIPHIGWFPDIQKAAFRMQIGERSGLIKSNAEFVPGYYIIRLKEKKDSYIPSFEDVKEKIENILIRKEAEALALKEAKRLHRKVLNLMKTRNLRFEEAASRTRHKTRPSEYFTRNDYIQGLGSASEIGEAAFDGKLDDISPVMRVRAGFCIFRVIDIISMDEQRFRTERKESAKKTQEAKKTRLLNEWYTALLKRAGLKNNIAVD